jgi:hypothetical protein
MAFADLGVGGLVIHYDSADSTAPRAGYANRLLMLPESVRAE